MPLDDFARSGLVVEVYSEVLGEEVLFAGDWAVVDPGESRVVYRAEDLLALLDCGPGKLRRIHAERRIRGGDARRCA